jgi:hypothetical protein
LATTEILDFAFQFCTDVFSVRLISLLFLLVIRSRSIAPIQLFLEALNGLPVATAYPDVAGFLF